MKASRKPGATIAEALISMGLFSLVLVVSLGALKAAMGLHLSAETSAGIERNLLQATSLLRAEARAAALVYGQDDAAGADVLFSNNFITNNTPAVVVRYRWDRDSGNLTRTKMLPTGEQGPFLVASSVTACEFRDMGGRLAQRGAILRLSVGSGDLERSAEILLLSRAGTSRPVQGGYYSSAFWLSFWKGWVEGVRQGYSGG